MYSQKLQPASVFPALDVTLATGETVNLATPAAGTDWKLVVIYRGKHCPLCTRYLNELENFVQPLQDIGVSVIAVSGDSLPQLEAHQTQLHVSFPLAYGLTQAQMEELGLYISQPRSDAETDHNFAEPGLFVVNAQGTIQVVDLSNNPFVRPDLATLVSGLTWIRNPDNNYPIRGTALN